MESQEKNVSRVLALDACWAVGVSVCRSIDLAVDLPPLKVGVVSFLFLYELHKASSCSIFGGFALSF